MSSFYSPQQFNQFSFGSQGQGGFARPKPMQSRPYSTPPMASGMNMQPSFGGGNMQGYGSVPFTGAPASGPVGYPASPPPPPQQSEPEPPPPPPPGPSNPPATNTNQGNIPGTFGLNLQPIDLSFLGTPGMVITPEMQRQMYKSGGASAADLQFLANLRTSAGNKGEVGRRMLQQFAEMDRRNKFLARRRRLAPRAPRLPGEQIMIID